MSLHDDLLDQAERLCSLDPKRPKQANLRRAISATYYALFHLLVGDAVALFLPARNKPLRHQLARKFTHKQMKAIAHAWSTSPGPRGLSLLADVFVELQEARHEADYDLSSRFTRRQAEDQVIRARAAVRAWSGVRTAPEAERFLIELLVGKL
ncbi:MAG: hypothetical protein HZB39_21400 [Planctomycetes bacterium]|nr:hypothetical protein [Planctomycetota bacterium]